MIEASAVRGALRRGVFVACVVMPAAIALAAGLSPREQAEDFDAMWRAVDSGYAYFDAGGSQWRRTRVTWKPRAERAPSRSDFVAALEGALAELRDDHVSLSERSASAARRIPFETDIWAQWRAGAATIEAVRPFGDADVAGLRPGHVVTSIGGVAVERAVRERLGSSRAPSSAKDRALVQVLAGPRRGVQKIAVRDANATAALQIERSEPRAASSPAVIGRRMGDERDIGYLRVRIGAGDDRMVEHFDGALDQLADTRALILDLRENPAPGSRAVTQAILARFVASETPWQWRQSRGGPRITDTVAPRGNAPYRAPVVVLVDRWTAGEGEALAAGLKAAAGARIVGTATAGLRGELREVRLPHSGIIVRYPAERTFLASGAPRESLRPDVGVDLAAPSGGPGDPILYQGLKLLETCPGSSCRSARDSPPPARGFPRR